MLFGKPKKRFSQNFLIDNKIAEKFLPKVKTALEEKGVELRGCERTVSIIDVKPATEDDWATEYLDYILSIKIVDCIDKAIEHINNFGSGHTDTIVTSDKGKAEKFIGL